MSYEILLSLKPDLVLAYGVTGAVNQEIARMEEFGLPVVLTAEYLEPHPLGKAEWLKFVAAFFEAGQLADSLFRSTADSYQDLAAIAEKAGNRPEVMLGLPWKDNWYISGGDSYAAVLINDAGGEYVFSTLDSRTSIPMELEAVYHRCLETDIWINPGAAMSMGEILRTDARLEDLKPFREGNIYSNHARVSPGGGNDYWESGTVQPHLILADLVRIFHPGLLENDSLYYYLPLK